MIFKLAIGFMICFMCSAWFTASRYNFKNSKRGTLTLFDNKASKNRGAPQESNEPEEFNNGIAYTIELPKQAGKTSSSTVVNLNGFRSQVLSGVLI